MENILLFDTAARRENLVFQRFSPGMSVRLGEQTALVRVENDQWHHRACGPWETVRIEDGDWYGIHYGVMIQRMGFSGLLPYVTDALPGRVFQLGFNAVAHVQTAHMTGLFSLLLQYDRMDALQLFHVLSGSMNQVVAAAFKEALGGGLPELRQITGRRQELQQAAEDVLFWLLFRNGLCLKRGSFAIQGFAQPTFSV